MFIVSISYWPGKSLFMTGTITAQLPSMQCETLKHYWIIHLSASNLKSHFYPAPARNVHRCLVLDFILSHWFFCTCAVQLQLLYLPVCHQLLMSAFIYLFIFLMPWLYSYLMVFPKHFWNKVFISLSVCSLTCIPCCKAASQSVALLPLSHGNVFMLLPSGSLFPSDFEFTWHTTSHTCTKYLLSYCERSDYANSADKTPEPCHLHRPYLHEWAAD